MVNNFSLISILASLSSTFHVNQLLLLELMQLARPTHIEISIPYTSDDRFAYSWASAPKRDGPLTRLLGRSNSFASPGTTKIETSLYTDSMLELGRLSYTSKERC